MSRQGDGASLETGGDPNKNQVAGNRQKPVAIGGSQVKSGAPLLNLQRRRQRQKPSHFLK